jgi:hypothetical protein
MGDNEELRPAFEAWATSRGWSLSHQAPIHGTRYHSIETQAAWEAWQDAHDAGVKHGMERERWRGTYIARLIEIGMPKEMALADFDGGDHDYTDDPAQAADEAASYYTNDEAP